jgi:hypothetical protein
VPFLCHFEVVRLKGVCKKLVGWFSTEEPADMTAYAPVNLSSVSQSRRMFDLQAVGHPVMSIASVSTPTSNLGRQAIGHPMMSTASVPTQTSNVGNYATTSFREAENHSAQPFICNTMGTGAPAALQHPTQPYGICNTVGWNIQYHNAEHSTALNFQRPSVDCATSASTRNGSTGDGEKKKLSRRARRRLHAQSKQQVELYNALKATAPRQFVFPTAYQSAQQWQR